MDITGLTQRQVTVVLAALAACSQAGGGSELYTVYCTVLAQHEALAPSDHHVVGYQLNAAREHRWALAEAEHQAGTNENELRAAKVEEILAFYLSNGYISVEQENWIREHPAT